MSKKPSVQTPGAETTGNLDDETGADGGGMVEANVPAALPPDLQALVAQAVAAEMARQKPAAASKKSEQLPTQEEALKMILADPKRRSILSKDGWVTVGTPVKEVDGNGFAKA